VVAATQTFATAPAYWDVPVVTGGRYRITTTGLTALVSNTGNGYDAVPAATGADVGTDFLFTTHNWGGGGLTVYAYDDTHVTVTPMAGGAAVVDTDLTRGTFLDRNGLGLNQ